MWYARDEKHYGSLALVQFCWSYHRPDTLTVIFKVVSEVLMAAAPCDDIQVRIIAILYDEYVRL